MALSAFKVFIQLESLRLGVYKSLNNDLAIQAASDVKIGNKLNEGLHAMTKGLMVYRMCKGSGCSLLLTHTSSHSAKDIGADCNHINHLDLECFLSPPFFYSFAITPGLFGSDSSARWQNRSEVYP